MSNKLLAKLQNQTGLRGVLEGLFRLGAKDWKPKQAWN